MTTIPRRRFLQAGSAGLGASLAGSAAAAAGSGYAPVAVPDSNRVRMMGDGLGLTPGEQGRLLAQMADEGRIERDSYSNGGTVEALEEQFATILGKERAVFMPTGTLANHLAVRSLAGAGGGRAIVQAEAHLYNDSGDCVQTLSSIPSDPARSGPRHLHPRPGEGNRGTHPRRARFAAGFGDLDRDSGSAARGRNVRSART